MRNIILLGVLLLFLVGCEAGTQQTQNETKEVITPPVAGTQCTKNSECVIGGCSGQICSPASKGRMVSTCEWREEYACYKKTTCGCIEGRCVWDQNPVFAVCVQEARTSNKVPIV